MDDATFHFYGDLQDFVPASRRESALHVPVGERPAVKHPIESLGAPHPEVGAIAVNGVGVGFEHRVTGGDEVEVWPVGDGCPGDCPSLRPTYVGPARFVLDAHLGRLVSYLRVLGFDTLYSNDADDCALAASSALETRILLTRDIGLLKRGNVVYGHWLRATDPRAQIVAVLCRYHLSVEMRPWSRCLRCNGLLVPVTKSEILSQLEPRTRLYYEHFERCAVCQRIYWQGSHHERMSRFLQEVLEEAEQYNERPASQH